MLVCPMSNGRNLQMFRGGMVQIFGNLSDAVAESMRSELIAKLSKILPSLRVTNLKIVNMVVSAKLTMDMTLKTIASSNSSVFYESELFPAALVQKWHPVHVAVFHNKRIVITGVKSMNELSSLLSNLSHFLSQSCT